MVISGCSKTDDTAAAPTKVEIDQGLKGMPKVDPSLSAGMGGGAQPMKGGMGGKGGAPTKAPAVDPNAPKTDAAPPTDPGTAK